MGGGTDETGSVVDDSSRDGEQWRGTPGDRQAAVVCRTGRHVRCPATGSSVTVISGRSLRWWSSDDPPSWSVTRGQRPRSHVVTAAVQFHTVPPTSRPAVIVPAASPDRSFSPWLLLLFCWYFFVYGVVTAHAIKCMILSLLCSQNVSFRTCSDIAFSVLAAAVWNRHAFNLLRPTRRDAMVWRRVASGRAMWIGHYTFPVVMSVLSPIEIHRVKWRHIVLDHDTIAILRV